MEGHALPLGQFWAFLLNGLSQTIELLAVFGGIDGLILWKQLIINHFLDISSNVTFFGSSFSSSLGTSILRSSGPIMLYVIVDDLSPVIIFSKTDASCSF